MADLSVTDGRFGIPDRSRGRGAPALGGERETVRRAPGPVPAGSGIRSADRHGRELASRVVPYTTDLDHPYMRSAAGVTWSEAGLWVADRALLGGSLPSGMASFLELPTRSVPVARVYGRHDVIGRTSVLIVGPEGRPVVVSRGAARDRAELAGQVTATLIAAAGHGGSPALVFLASLTSQVSDELAGRTDLSHEWRLEVDDIPSRVVRLLGLRGAGDEELLGT